MGFQRLFLAFLAFSCFPLSVSILILNYLYLSILPLRPVHKQLQKTLGFKSRVVLITGITTPYGLRLARAFQRTGHSVIGADHEPGGLPSHARFSNALTRFYKLAYDEGEPFATAYAASLLNIVQQEHVKLWINCKRAANFTTEARARDVLEHNTDCACFALRLDDMLHLADREAFMKYLTNQGLPVPESHQVKSRAEIHNVLGKARGSRKYLLHGPEPNGVHANTARTMLPGRTPSQTYDAVSRITIAESTPWKLEQDVDALDRYFTFAIIVKGSLKAFAAGRSFNRGSLRALDPKSALFYSMLQFVVVFVRQQRPDFTTHLGIEFVVDEQATASGVRQAILPLQVSGCAQAAMEFFHGMNGSVQLTTAYLSIFAVGQENFDKKLTRPVTAVIQQARTDEVAMPATSIPGTYCFGQVLVHLCLQPLHDLVTLRCGLTQFVQMVAQFLHHLIAWDDDQYDFRDPLPFWMLYQVYIPLRLVKSALFLDQDPV